MQLYQTFYFKEAAFISFMDEQEKLVAFMVGSKDKVRRLLLTHAFDDEDMEQYLKTLDEVVLSETTTTPVVRYDGTFIQDLCAIISEGFGTEGVDMEEPITYLPNEFFLLYLPTTTESDSGLLHYSDDSCEHHIAAVFSKQQCEKVLDGLRWSHKETRTTLGKAAQECTLPDTSDREPIFIGGRFAALLNTIVANYEIPDGDEPENLPN